MIKTIRLFEAAIEAGEWGFRKN